MFFVQASTRPPTHALKAYQTWKQNNQLLTKSHDDLKDNSNVIYVTATIIKQNLQLFHVCMVFKVSDPRGHDTRLKILTTNQVMFNLVVRGYGIYW